MSVRVNVRMSQIMRMPIKVGGRMYPTYANCRTLKKVVPFAPFIFDKIIYISNKNKTLILYIIIISFGEH